MQAANTGGSSGYAGYEYQKGVTTWLSLELMIAKAVADSIIVEPRSQEDIEAALHYLQSKKFADLEVWNDSYVAQWFALTFRWCS